MKYEYELSLYLVLICLLGFLVGRNLYPITSEEPVPVSKWSIHEIALTCENYKDLAVSREFVYAKCPNGESLTIPNYGLK